MDRFDVVSEAAIVDGTATDAYFRRTEEALAAAGRDPTVVAEVTLGQFPGEGKGESESESEDHHVFAGVKDVANLLAGRAVDADAVREGRLCSGGPVLRIEGRYREFAPLETSLLGFLSQASAFATRALETRLAAPTSRVMSFGTRHLHPGVAACLERSALVGGLDGISHVAAGERIGVEAGGTMPHALLLCFGEGEQEAAWRAFDEAVDPDVPRVALCDTFADEATEAVRAAETVPDLDGVRLDTTGSRRGDFRQIVREVRWELDQHGHEDVDVFCSGGMTPAAMRRLRDVADGFGVGSYVTDADPLNFGLDVVEVDGEPVAKRGRLPGKKELYRSEDGDQVALADADADTEGEPLLAPLVRDGEVVREFDLDAAAARAVEDAELFDVAAGGE
ncbi:nicotinate phosphoribosyltransferase [Halobacteriales archaeon SW_12_71_31]|nr:MAG: nicotinate phosphoribosyltransferase [Halobacteriales archaeon SW_12_71_31]